LAPHVSPANDRLGVDRELPLFVALSPTFDTTLYHRQMEKRGAKNGLEFRYAITENNYGTIYGDYFRDANVTGSADPLLGATDDKRWSLYYNHFSSFGDGAYLRADIARVSDRWYFRDLSAHNYYLTNKDTGDGDKFRKVSFSGDEALVALDATIRLVKNSERYSVTALLKYTEDLTQESNNASLQRYPEITASIIRQRFFASPLFFAMQNSLGYYYQYGGAGGGYAGDFNPTFSLPLQFDYFLFSPTVGAQLTAWHDKNNTAGTATDSRSVVKTGFFASTDLSRVYNFNLLGVEKIKHSVRPEVAYAYHEGYQEHSAYLPAYVSALPPQNLISLSLINEIIARETDANDKPHYRQFLYAKISQTFNVTEAQRDYGAAPQRPLGNLSLLMDFTPHRYFSFSLRDIFSTNEGIFLTENYEMRISDYRGDSAHVSYRYDWVGNIRELYYGVDFALNPSAKLSFNHRRDLLNNRDVGTGYSLAYKKDCWDFLVNYSKTTSLDAYGREYDDWSIKFLLNLRGLGGLSF
ncbi:MAG: LPS assembly protein LptD, partial [Deltaproteobacteria bacterium]|nr:LPS assembly protein LptD [Deltaproteobacteria bacterium]